MPRWTDACLTWPHPIESCFQFLDELFAIEVPIDTLAIYIAYTTCYILIVALTTLIIAGLAIAIREVFCQPIIAPSRAYVRTRNFCVTAFYKWTGLQLLLEQSVMRPRFMYPHQQAQIGSSPGSSRGKQRATRLPREELMEELEEQAGRTISIETDDNPEVLSRCNPQSDSPLFQLPRELRDRIWQYTTATYEDSNNNNKHAATAYYYRPGHTALLETDTNVLLTCRRVWLEAHSLPLQQTEHTFWFQRGPHDQLGERHWRTNVIKETERAISTFRHLTSARYRDLSFVNLHTQMFLFDWFAMLAAQPMHPPSRTETAPISGFFRSGISPQNFRPKVLQITIRHTDWWHWERDEPLRFLDERLAIILDHAFLRGVQHLKLELETLDYKRDQLDAIASRLRQMHGREQPTHLVDGSPVTTKFIPSDRVEESTWTGPTNINNEHRPIYAARKELKYICMTLTWDLIFPSLPQGNVNKLRWEPRFVQPQAAGTTGGSAGPDELAARIREYDTNWWTMYEDMNAGDSDVEEPRTPFNAAVQLRRRLWRRLRFVWPAFVGAVEVREKQKEQGDDLVETYGRRFESTRQQVRVNEIEEQWARTGSLLRFEPLNETAFAA